MTKHLIDSLILKTHVKYCRTQFSNMFKLCNSINTKYYSHQNFVTGEWHFDVLVSENRARYTDPITENKYQ